MKPVMEYKALIIQIRATVKRSEQQKGQMVEKYPKGQKHQNNQNAGGRSTTAF